MKKAKRLLKTTGSNVVGLGWANRAVSRTAQPTLDIRKATALADDLVASIERACWLTYDKQANLHGPTLHMAMAVSAYLEWKRENNV